MIYQFFIFEFTLLQFICVCGVLIVIGYIVADQYIKEKNDS